MGSEIIYCLQYETHVLEEEEFNHVCYIAKRMAEIWEKIEKEESKWEGEKGCKDIKKV